MTPEKPVPHLSEGEKETLSDAARKYSDFGIYSLSESSMQKCQAFIAGAQWQERQSTQMYTAEQISLAYDEICHVLRPQFNEAAINTIKNLLIGELKSPPKQ